MFSVVDGKEFVKIARKSIGYSMHTNSLLAAQCPRKEYGEKLGVFVTLQTHPKRELRGCIGFTEPIKPLWDGIIDAAFGAAFRDPRFRALEAGELEKIIIEVSVLTKPEEIIVKKQGELPGAIEIGADGLIVENGSDRGLLLPQVPGEFGWNAEEFLEHTCEKAGLPKEAWKEKETVFYKFQAQIFSEKGPNGEVIGN